MLKLSQTIILRSALSVELEIIMVCIYKTVWDTKFTKKITITEKNAFKSYVCKVSLHSNPKERQCQRMLKLRHIALISHSSNVMLKILQARLQHHVNCELPDVQAGFRKGRGTRDQIANIHWIMEKAREFQKNIYFCFID